MIAAAEATARDLLIANMPTEAIIEQTNLSAGTIRALRRELKADAA
jgi:hypothetical protein